MYQRHALIFASTLLAMLSVATVEAATCESLADVNLPQTTITAASTVAAGDFTPPGPPALASAVARFKKLPAFCRVQGVIRPSSDSHIEFEVWLPSSGWNGKFLGVGNGGFAGSIRYVSLPGNTGADMAAALAGGYATASTDTGHKASGFDATWALGHPEKMIDYGYRGIHETVVRAKAIIGAFYGTPPRKSYFNSCSNGGRQGLMEAQRYPEDYDGILAGAPSYAGTRGTAAFLWNTLALMADPASFIPPGKLPAIEAAALKACDTSDGIKDGVVENPTKCRFDPAVLLCQGVESDSCLTPSQIVALKKIYAGPKDSKGSQIFPGILPGAESGWASSITGTKPGTSSSYAFGVGALSNMLYQDPAWDFRSFNLDRDVPIMDEKLGHFRNAIDPNLQPFKERGGKLILYHGWNDPLIAPESTVRYYQAVVSKMGQKNTEEFVRLYMVPGMSHCGGGPGTISFGASDGGDQDPERSIVTALERWVEHGVAPDKIIAARYKTAHDPASGLVRTRPLCRYPQVMQYKGSGSTDDSANFVCKSP